MNGTKSLTEIKRSLKQLIVKTKWSLEKLYTITIQYQTVTKSKLY